MNAKMIQAVQVETQDTVTEHPHTDGLPLLPGFISFYQNAQPNQLETGQLYATIDADPDDIGNSMEDDIPLQRAKMHQR